ncbi:MAG: hypothetical protein M5U12_04485 [Verrucomicrobia bacterium]|nr:hypothetical protein [Verrucomicrobiota bacterium]
MAFRIHDSVARGEIDNRVKGTVRGRIWLAGGAAPLELVLAGDAHPDLAGCLLTFVNPRPQPNPRDLKGLYPQQHGTIGDLTASRKVRVPAVPMEEFLNWPKEKGRPRHGGRTASTSSGSARPTGAWSSRARITN